MGVAVNGWLKGKRARLIGASESIRTALERAGATTVSDGDADLLVHVADAPVRKLAHEIDHGEWRGVLDEGLDQRFLAAQAFAQGCRAAKSGGAVVFVGAPEQSLGSDHAAAAGALGNLVKTLGVEWARDGIRVNAILTRETGDTLGNLAAYLLSDYAAYVTGAVMGIGLDDG